MSYFVTHRTGAMEGHLPVDSFSVLLDELEDADQEHPDVSITHETEWMLTVFRSGLVVLENLEAGAPVHLGPIDRSSIVKLMIAVSEGRIEDVMAFGSWNDGYPTR